MMDTEATDFVLGTHFFVEHSQILSLTLQAPYVLQVDHGDGGESVPVEQSEHTSRYVNLAVPTTVHHMAIPHANSCRRHGVLQVPTR